MFTYLELSELNETQLEQYRKATNDAYPAFLINSLVVTNYWNKLESHFPEFQVSMINNENQLIGFINTIPIHWDQAQEDLPDEGWDWLIQKGFSDLDNGMPPNYLGGLQINILKDFQGKGYAKILIKKGKEIMQKGNFQYFILPIRPTFKWKHPNMSMNEYLHLQRDGKLVDPWIRIHLKSGAKIIQVCSNSMNVAGNIKYWEDALGLQISRSEAFIVKGALNPIRINIENDFGEYREENIWIYYS